MGCREFIDDESRCNGKMSADDVQYVSGARGELEPRLYEALGIYRRRVFVDTLGWQLPDAGLFEFDQFDRDDTLHVIALNEEGAVVGCARLLPTMRPYLLADVFGELLVGTAAPRSPSLWEISRFSTMRFDVSSSGSDGPSLFSRHAPELLRVSIEVAVSHGAKQLISVSPVAVERRLAREGFRWKRFGRAMRLPRGAIVAGYIDWASQSAAHESAPSRRESRHAHSSSSSLRPGQQRQSGQIRCQTSRGLRID